MFDDWDAVRARLWDPMMTTEQSSSNFHNRMFSTDINDDEFFRGLPVQARDDKKSKKVSRKSASKDDRDDRQAFSTYSFSNSTVMDGKGRQVTSMRRRYEDSSGRLRVVHERRVEGKKLRTTWDRDSQEDKGRLESVCSSGTPDEFEAMWLKTPLGRAKKEAIKEQGEEQLPDGDEQDNLPRSKL